ncbi:MAG: L-threonylcarbamoyladenylate synthase [Dehalococcoidia bacterium]|nr:L-threonylcarbamoyladenylate synthase [Dehalococcoidia bacterium]
MKQQLESAVAILRKGGVIAYPTDTVYGLGADAFNEEAVRRIYRIKQRPLSQPFPVLLADKADLSQLAATIPEVAWNLIEHFFPGQLTLVFLKSATVPQWVTAGGNTVAIRIPDHPLALELIRALGRPLIGTSANLTGSPSAITAAEVYAQLGDAVDFILDGGVCPGGIESTVVDVTGGAPVIIREGAISRESIAMVWDGIR